MIFMIESQIHYILDARRVMDQKKLQAIDVLPEIQQRYNQQLRARLDRTAWQSGCKSWYHTGKRGKHRPLARVYL